MESAGQTQEDGGVRVACMPGTLPQGGQMPCRPDASVDNLQDMSKQHSTRTPSTPTLAMYSIDKNLLQTASPQSAPPPPPLGARDDFKAHGGGCIQGDRDITATAALGQDKELELARTKERLASSSAVVSDLQARMVQRDTEVRDLRDKLVAREREILQLRAMVATVEVLDVETGTSERMEDDEVEPATERIAKERDAGSTPGPL